LQLLSSSFSRFSVSSPAYYGFWYKITCLPGGDRKRGFAGVFRRMSPVCACLDYHKEASDRHRKYIVFLNLVRELVHCKLVLMKAFDCVIDIFGRVAKWTQKV
jgi:hypothetical protein